MVSDKVYEALLYRFEVSRHPDRFIEIVKSVNDPKIRLKSEYPVLNIEDKVKRAIVNRNGVVIDAFMADVDAGRKYCQRTLSESNDLIERIKAASMLYAMSVDPKSTPDNQSICRQVLHEHCEEEEDYGIVERIHKYLEYHNHHG